MFHLLKRILKARLGEKETNVSLKLTDLDAKPLQDGDRVLSLRYGLGECILRAGGEGIYYESVETGEKVSYARMVDASTNFQKVRKLD